VKKLSFFLLVAVITVLITATMLEKLYGTFFVATYVYGAWWFVALWALLAFSAVFYICQRKVFRRPATFVLHLSFLIILFGALITHLTGVQASLHLRVEESTHLMLDSDTQLTRNLPFQVKLIRFNVHTYPGTQSPMDYISVVTISNNEQTDTLTISMNRIGSYHSYRFYQSGYDPDMQGAHLTVSYDPWGITLTYVGYGLLFLSMLLLLVLPHEGFRPLLHQMHSKIEIFACLMFLLPFYCYTAQAQDVPKVLPRHVAAEFGNLHVYYNGRVCPFQTMAIDFTTKLYGRSSYHGYSAEQVTTGFMLFPTSWIDQPIIKIKKGVVGQILKTDRSCVSYNDFFNLGSYRLDESLIDMRQKGTLAVNRAVVEADEKMNLLLMLFNGQLLKIYPAQQQWYSQADNLPEELPHNQWFFIKHSMDYIGELAVQGNYSELVHTLAKIRDYQVKTMGADNLPTPLRFKAEKCYNQINYIKPLAMVLLTIGIVAFLLLLFVSPSAVWHRRFHYLLLLLLIIVIGYLLFYITLRSFVSQHLPLANGYEVMVFMSFSSLLLTLCFWKRYPSIRSYGFIMAGLTLLVAMMGQSNPQITHLMPVLASPLLSIHVCVIMLSYTLFAFIMLNSLAALLTRRSSLKAVFNSYYTGLLMLYPAIFFLTAGIFIGAIWANVSWGRYWGWDPKEVWALITMFIYSFPLHRKSIRWFNNPLHFHLYMILAFLSVVITYFGVNFFLGGMHSYAG